MGSFVGAWARVRGIGSAVTQAEAAVLWRHACDAPERVVEVGAWTGRTACLLGYAVGRENTVVTIDPFDGTVGVGGTTFRPEVRSLLLSNIKARRLRNVDHWHLHSADAAARWDVGERGAVSLLWVDGDHSLAGTMADWEAWKPKLAPEARVVLHDKGMPGPAAVIERARAEGWRVEEPAGCLAVLHPPGATLHG